LKKNNIVIQQYLEVIELRIEREFNNKNNNCDCFNIIILITNK